MEACTAFLVGPLCLLTVAGMLGARPWRYTLMICVSVCQIYGDVLYYGTCYLEGEARGARARGTRGARPSPLAPPLHAVQALCTRAPRTSTFGATLSSSTPSGS